MNSPDVEARETMTKDSIGETIRTCLRRIGYMQKETLLPILKDQNFEVMIKISAKSENITIPTSDDLADWLQLFSKLEFVIHTIHKKDIPDDMVKDLHLGLVLVQLEEYIVFIHLKQ